MIWDKNHDDDIIGDLGLGFDLGDIFFEVGSAEAGLVKILLEIEEEQKQVGTKIWFEFRLMMQSWEGFSSSTWHLSFLHSLSNDVYTHVVRVHCVSSLLLLFCNFHSEL